MPPLQPNYASLCMLLGEKEVTIMQLGEEFNRVSGELEQAKKKIEELNGRLELASKHNSLRVRARRNKSGRHRRSDNVPQRPDESANGVDQIQSGIEPT